MSSTQSIIPAVVPTEGWHVLHLYYRIQHSAWQCLDAAEQQSARDHFLQTIAAVRSHPATQLLVFSVVSPKADLGMMILTPDLQDANRFEKMLTLSLGSDILEPVYCYFSMTEISEYVTSDEAYAESLKREKNLEAGSEEFDKEMGEFRARMKKYNQDKLYPNMADWPVLCFYPMSKRREPTQNWYATSFEVRKELMAGHARVGRKWHGKIRQLITGSTGLDEMEWGVTLLAHNTYDVKGIVYEMRFDEVSAQYAEFGDFYIGLQIPPDEILKRLLLA